MHHGIIFSIFRVEYPLSNTNPTKGLPSTPATRDGDAVTNFLHPASQWRGQYGRSGGSHKIASHLRETGEWDVEVVDFWDAFSFKDMVELLDQRITKDTVFVGFSLPFTARHQKQINMHKYIKHNYPWVATVAGGMTFAAISLCEVDYYVIGRGEYGMEQLCKRLTNSGESVRLKKMYTGKGDNVKEYKIVDCREDYPAEPKPRVKVSFEERDYITPDETLTIELSRGCRFQCAFCDYYPLGVKGDWTRDRDDFESEMRENYDRWGVTNYLLTDETINDRTEKIEKFGAVVKDLPFKPRFAGYMRSDLLLSRGQREIDALLEMGVMGHWYGVESLNHQSAKSIGKGMASERVKEGLLELDKIFTVNMSFILGLPYETLESMKDTQRWVDENFSHRYVNMYPLELGRDANGIDIASKLDVKSEYSWTNILGITEWVHPHHGYTSKDVRNLQTDWYRNSYHGMPSIWSLPWVTSLGMDPDIVYNVRDRSTFETLFPESSQDIWNKKIEHYRLKKLSI